MNISHVWRMAAMSCVVILCSTTAHASNRLWHLPRAPITIDVPEMSRHELQELRCQALNIYHEARGSTVINQVAVAWVVRNRMERSGKSACEVVFEPRQFSWTARRVGAPREADAWRRAQELALLVMEDQIVDITRGATHFHETTIRPTWSRRAKQSVRIGAHVFHRLEQVAEAR